MDVKYKLAACVIIVAVLMIIVIIAAGAHTYAVDIGGGITVHTYDHGTDYMQLMRDAAADGSKHALIAGIVYEKQRNLKIEKLSLPYEQTRYFLDYQTGADILEAMQKDSAYIGSYSEEDLDLLSRIIYAEAGSDWIPDRVQLLVGSVVLNRVASSKFPNTIHDVIYQKGQYSPTWNGAINKTPNNRAITNAKILLENGSICPAEVLCQAQRAWGPVYEIYHDRILGTTTYFSYLED